MKKSYLTAQHRTVDRKEYPARNRVKSIYSDGAESVHYEHLEMDQIDINRQAFNGRSGPVILACVLCIALGLSGVIEVVKWFFS